MPRTRFHRRSRSGQSLVELALVLPVVMLLLLVGLDFGRVFLGYVNLGNSTKVAANFAAQNPSAWNATPDAADLAVQAEYQRLVTADATGTNCTMPTPIPTPTFPSGISIGSPASVRMTCNFSLITPVIGAIVGNSLAVSASAAFPIRAGIINGIPVAPGTPTPTPTATPAPTPTPTATPTVPPGPTPTPSPVPSCTVPDLTHANSANADRDWADAHFTGLLIYNPLVPPNYNIDHQSLPAGSSVPCNSNITVTP
jgi:Flp pilus assembly protein TadG